MRNARHCQNAQNTGHKGTVDAPASNLRRSRNNVLPSSSAETAIVWCQLVTTASPPETPRPESITERTPGRGSSKLRSIICVPTGTTPNALPATGCSPSVHKAGKPFVSSDSNVVNGHDTARNTSGLRIARHAASGGQLRVNFRSTCTFTVCGSSRGNAVSAPDVVTHSQTNQHGGSP